MERHLPYPRIRQHTRYWRPTRAEQHALDRARWCAQEKVHGACFCVLVPPTRTPNAVVCAKRRAVLGPTESFFAHESLLARDGGALAAQAVAVAHAVDPGPRAPRTVAVYGELCGGAYPHPDVPRDAHAPAPVQTGIAYSPRIEFYAFDIAVAREGGGWAFVDYARALDVFHSVGVFCAEPMATGTLQEMLALPLGFDSTLPARLGLPPLPSGTNAAEGVVVRPLTELAVSVAGSTARAIIKRKIAAFAEDARYHGSTAAISAGNGGPTDADLLGYEAAALINTPRLRAAESKTGPVRQRGDRDRAAELLDEFVSDVQTALAEEHAAALARLDDAARAALDAQIVAACQDKVVGDVGRRWRTRQ